MHTTVSWSMRTISGLRRLKRTNNGNRRNCITAVWRMVGTKGHAGNKPHSGHRLQIRRYPKVGSVASARLVDWRHEIRPAAAVPRAPIRTDHLYRLREVLPFRLTGRGSRSASTLLGFVHLRGDDTVARRVREQPTPGAGGGLLTQSSAPASRARMRSSWASASAGMMILTLPEDVVSNSPPPAETFPLRRDPKPAPCAASLGPFRTEGAAGSKSWRPKF
jgi:hypothetical protein